MEIPLLVMPIMMSQILKSVDFTKAQKSRYLENKILFFLQIKKVDITKPCTHLLHPAHFSLQLALCNTFSVIRTKISHLIEQFPRFMPKNSKLFVLPENWHTILNLFLGKFGPKRSKLTVLPENWHTWYLEDTDSYSHISF